MKQKAKHRNRSTGGCRYRNLLWKQTAEKVPRTQQQNRPLRLL